MNECVIVQVNRTVISRYAIDELVPFEGHQLNAVSFQIERHVYPVM